MFRLHEAHKYECLTIVQQDTLHTAVFTGAHCNIMLIDISFLIVSVLLMTGLQKYLSCQNGRTKNHKFDPHRLCSTNRCTKPHSLG